MNEQQVLIKATIAEVTLNNDLQFGLQWFFNNDRATTTLSTAASGAVAATFPGASTVLNWGDPRVVLSALREITNVNVVSAPQLMVLDHQTAMLQVDDEVPIAVQQARSVVDPDAPIVNSVQLRSIGVILKVTPRVNSNGMATLENRAGGQRRGAHHHVEYRLTHDPAATHPLRCGRRRQPDDCAGWPDP